jgi:hypothetical protein
MPQDHVEKSFIKLNHYVNARCGGGIIESQYGFSQITSLIQMIITTCSVVKIRHSSTKRKRIESNALGSIILHNLFRSNYRDGGDNSFFGFFLGLSQYALLHFGQTLGYSSLLRGTQVCPHRSHWYPWRVIFAISLNYITSSI